MFAAVTLLVGEALLCARAIWRGDVPGLAAARRLLGPRPIVGSGTVALVVAVDVVLFVAIVADMVLEPF